MRPLVKDSWRALSALLAAGLVFGSSVVIALVVTAKDTASSIQSTPPPQSVSWFRIDTTSVAYLAAAQEAAETAWLFGIHQQAELDAIRAAQAAATRRPRSGGGGGGGCSEAEIIRRESGGNPRAVNRSSGAGGLYQFLPSTWAGRGGYANAADAPVELQRQAYFEVRASNPRAWAASGC